MKRDTVPVSVIAPCYCCSDTIERAVQSVIDQVARPLELFLVDDASPDDGETLAKLHALQKRFNDMIRIDVLALESNGGPAAARNAAWDRASQPYVAFLDADDAWFPDKLHVQFEWMQAHPEVVLSGHICANPETEQSTESSEDIVATRVNRLSVLLSNPFSTPSAMLKSELPFRFPAKKSFAEDFFLWQQIVCAGYPVVRLEKVMARLYKAPYGEAGLSSRMWEMERAELDNYRRLWKQGCISGLMRVLLSAYSLAKFLKRLFVVSMRRYMKA